MTREVVRVRGSFVSLIDDPLPILMIQPHQIAAAADPASAADALGRTSKPRRRPSARRINERLSAPKSP